MLIGGVVGLFSSGARRAGTEDPTAHPGGEGGGEPRDPDESPREPGQRPPGI